MNQKQYYEALIKIETAVDKDYFTPQDEILLIEVNEYENKKYAINEPSPLDALKFRMDQLDLKNKDLADIVGSKSHASEILAGKKELSKKDIFRIHNKLGIPYCVLMPKFADKKAFSAKACLKKGGLK